MKPLETVAKFMNSVGLLRVLIVKLLEGLRNYAYQKFMGFDEEQQFLDRIIFPIQNDLKLLRKEIQDKHLTAEDLDQAISEAVLSETELGNSLLQGTNTYRLLNNIQTELSDVLNVENLEQLTERDFSNRLKKGLQNIRKSSPDLLTQENISGAFNFIREKAVKNEAFKKFDYESLIASSSESPEKKPEEDPYLAYLNYKPVPPSKFDPAIHRFPDRKPAAPLSESDNQDPSLPPRRTSYEKMLDDLKLYKVESPTITSKLYKKIQDDMDEQVAKLQDALAAPKTKLVTDEPKLLNADDPTIPKFSLGNQTGLQPVAEIEQQLPYARL